MKTIFQNALKILIFFISIVSYSQWSDGGGRVNMTDEYELITTIGFTEIDNASKEVVGSSYINENFLRAHITNKKMVYSMRYNAYRDEMEIELEGKPFYLPKTSYYAINFDFPDKEYQLFNFEEKGETKKGFFVVISKNGATSLLLKEKIKLYKEVPAKLGFTRYEPPKLGRLDDKIYIGTNQEAVELPKKKKDILNFFNDKSKDLESYAKKNKYSFNKTEDLIKIISYYNSMN